MSRDFFSPSPPDPYPTQMCATCGASLEGQVGPRHQNFHHGERERL